MKLHVCEWCGRPARRHVELTPGRVGTFNGRAKPILARRVHVCAAHAKMVDDGRGWQDGIDYGIQLEMGV